MTGQCDRQCQCMGRGNVQCSAASCSDSEVCKVRDGVMGCERAGQATCYVYGDPHYITFDGKAYNYQGNCNYTLAKTCGPSAVQFTITTRNDLLGHAWSALDSVALEVEGLHVAVRSDKKVYVSFNPTLGWWASFFLHGFGLLNSTNSLCDAQFCYVLIFVSNSNY